MRVTSYTKLSIKYLTWFRNKFSLILNLIKHHDFKITKMSVKKPLNVIFYSIESVGHMNSCIGIAQVLLEAGHRIQFIISELWKGKLIGYGFEEVLVSKGTELVDLDPSMNSSDQFQKSGALDPVTPLEKAKAILTNIVPTRINEAKYMDPILEELLKTLKPDLIVMDQVLCVPAVEKSDIPWIYSCSFNPLMGFQMRSNMDNDVLPPNFSGLPTNGDKREWNEFRKELYKSVGNTIEDFNYYVISRGLPNWYRFDNLKRTEVKANFEIPDQLRGEPGKLIYFSMGTFGSGNLDMMNRY